MNLIFGEFVSRFKQLPVKLDVKKIERPGHVNVKIVTDPGRGN